MSTSNGLDDALGRGRVNVFRPKIRRRSSGRPPGDPRGSRGDTFIAGDACPPIHQPARQRCSLLPEASQGYRVSPLRDFFRIVMMQHFGHLLEENVRAGGGAGALHNGRPLYVLRSVSCLFWLDVDLSTFRASVFFRYWG